MNATSVDTVVEPGSTPGKILSTYAIRACLFLIFLKKDPDSIKEQVFVYLSLMKSRHENQARKSDLANCHLFSLLAATPEFVACFTVLSAIAMKT
jgi:hypothetical protein